MTFKEYLDARHHCSRPDFRLLEETEYHRRIVCLTCKEDWYITRSKLKQYAREENEKDRFRELSESERGRVKVFGVAYAGTRHA
jgi:hypothetical protein